MDANDSTPGNRQNSSEQSVDQTELSARFADLWDRLRLAFLEAGVDIEEGEADHDLVEELRDELAEAEDAVDELEEFVENCEDNN